MTSLRGFLNEPFPNTYKLNVACLCTVCVYRVLKRIGGYWLCGDMSVGQHHQVDGDKFICLDPILNKDSCIVYSFGVASDWTFEDQMDNLGQISKLWPLNIIFLDQGYQSPITISKYQLSATLI